MTSDQIHELKDLFCTAMINWDVPVSVIVLNNAVTVSFQLWGTKFEGVFTLEKGEWTDGNDCPHRITDSESVWQWIAMQLHDQLTA